MIDGFQVVRDSVQEVEEQALGLRKDYIKDGELPEDFPLPYLTWEEIEDILAGKDTIDLGQPDEVEIYSNRTFGYCILFSAGCTFCWTVETFYGPP